MIDDPPSDEPPSIEPPGFEPGPSSLASRPPLVVERWPSEQPLLALVIIASLLIWGLLALTIVGFLYVALIGLFLFFARLLSVVHIRGSAVKLGPRQFPELWRRVVELGRRIDLDPVPDAYLMEAGGSLNAFATRFFRSRIVVLHSDLLDACGPDTAARDMVIGHELGHVKAGHLGARWLLAPGMLVPFLGSAYSRARELTCDRYGAALSGERAGALRGLTILAAGGRHGPRVDLESFVAQRRDLATGWMTLGSWLSSYPPLCDRVAALEPSLAGGRAPSAGAALRAVALVVGLATIPIGLSAGLVALVMAPAFQQAMAEVEAGERATLEGPVSPVVDEEEALAQIEHDFQLLSAFVLDLAEGGPLPATSGELWEAWEGRWEPDEMPLDPFDGFAYGYESWDDGFLFWSSGPDGQSDTEDDIVVEYEVPRVTRL